MRSYAYGMTRFANKEDLYPLMEEVSYHLALSAALLRPRFC